MKNRLVIGDSYKIESNLKGQQKVILSCMRERDVRAIIKDLFIIWRWDEKGF